MALSWFTSSITDILKEILNKKSRIVTSFMRIMRILKITVVVERVMYCDIRITEGRHETG